MKPWVGAALVNDSALVKDATRPEERIVVGRATDLSRPSFEGLVSLKFNYYT